MCKMRPFLILFLIVIAACQTKKEEEKQVAKLDPIACSILKQFSTDLTSSINRYEFTKFRGSWSDSSFKARIVGLTKIEKMLLREYYQEVFASEILNQPIEVIRTLKAYDGHMSFDKIIYYPRHAEATFSYTYLNAVGFWKLKLVLINGRPMVTDLYSFKEKKWLSKKIKSYLRLNAKYTSVSEERRNANLFQIEASNLLRAGDTVAALAKLYQIPSDYKLGDDLSLQRMQLAYSLGDSYFAESLEREQELNPSPYINYVCAYQYGDTQQLNSSIRQLEKELNISNSITDSLYNGYFYWQ